MKFSFWAVHQTLDSPGTPAVAIKNFLSVMKVVFVCNYLLSFIHQFVSRNVHFFEGGILWKIIGFATWVRILADYLNRISYILEASPYSNLFSSIFTRLISSIDVSMETTTLFNDDSNKKFCFCSLKYCTESHETQRRFGFNSTSKLLDFLSTGLIYLIENANGKFTVVKNASFDEIFILTQASNSSESESLS